MLTKEGGKKVSVEAEIGEVRFDKDTGEVLMLVKDAQQKRVSLKVNTQAVFADPANPVLDF